MVGRHGEAVTFAWRWIQDRLPPGPARHASAALLATIAITVPSSDHVESWNIDGDSVPPRPPSPSAVQMESRGCTDVLVTDVGGVIDRGADPSASDASASDAAREERNSGGARPLTVACVRWGEKYGPEYVERLAAGVRRHLRTDHRFVCYTDDAEALRGMVGIVARPLGTGCGEWRGWWHKAFLFSR